LLLPPAAEAPAEGEPAFGDEDDEGEVTSAVQARFVPAVRTDTRAANRPPATSGLITLPSVGTPLNPSAKRRAGDSGTLATLAPGRPWLRLSFIRTRFDMVHRQVGSGDGRGRGIEGIRLRFDRRV